MKDIIKELNVEKLNIVEEDGQVKLSLFNSKNIPSLIMDGIDLLPNHRANDGVSGLMFYNNHGDEVGGLIYGSHVDQEGNVSMGMSMTMDKWKQDQVVQLHLQKEGDLEQYGLSIYDRPNKHIKESLDLLKKYQEESKEEQKKEYLNELQKDNQKRIFVGKDFDSATKIVLYDSKGLDQIHLSIDSEDQVHLKIQGKEIDISKILK